MISIRTLLATVVILLQGGLVRAAAPGAGPEAIPPLIWVAPFAFFLLAIALLPQMPGVSQWWHHNRNRLLVAVVVSLLVAGYYLLRGQGFHGTEPGWPALVAMLNHALLRDYFPFMVMLFALYVISGGVRLTGDIPAHPLTNTLLLGGGAVLANLIGTTGASMLLIRPLLQINSERKYVRHTVIFFIFLVSNIGGSLLPIGDPPLFLGYLRGVPFFWTLQLVPAWACCMVLVLAAYWLVDVRAWRRETVIDRTLDDSIREPMSIQGSFNFVLLLGVVLAVALLVPGRTIPGTTWLVPNIYLREWVQLILTGLSLGLTPAAVRRANQFNFHPINEVACVFLGIFITVQVPLEILQARGPELGLTSALQYFWITGLLSSVLDNAPTYLVFFETAGTLPPGATSIHGLATVTGAIQEPLLLAISCGAVFMGALTYIGNGPNLMVRSIAEQAGIKMPGFFGYMPWSLGILLPVFVVVSALFFAR